jgi:chromosome partitioning protein
LSAAELYLVNEVGREYVLSRALGPIANDYDVILIDCQPSLGLLTLNALAASKGVLIPLECEYFALRGVALLIQTIQKVQQRINPELDLLGILPTMYDARTVHAREVLNRVEETFPDKLFETVITRTVKFPETTVAGLPITEYAPSSGAAQAYQRLAREVLVK